MADITQNLAFQTQIPTMEHIFPIYQVDAFTDTPFAGNPAAVCYLMAPRSDDWMQNVAREMNLSETAFFVPKKDGKFSLRWFTPTAEVDLCGHATLATAYIIWETQMIRPDESIEFETKSGVLAARQINGKIEIDLPNEAASEAPLPAGMAEILPDDIVWFGKNRMDFMVEMASPEAVRAYQPDLRRLARQDARGLIVTARADRPGFDFISRFFGPAVGVDEDPVTGSAHCCLGPYWAEKLQKKVLEGWQASERGGAVQVEPNGDRVLLRGNAVIVMQGVISA